MLVKLIIKNYALIEDLEMNPSNQLTVITGETGAGKSIMLGAVGLLLGVRADTKVLLNEKEKCVIEGTYTIADYHLQELFEEENLDYDNTSIIRREISSNGKSRAFINDTPVTLDVLKKIGGKLMDIHSQHETLDLASRSFQLQLIDAFSKNKKEQSAYAKSWSEYITAKNKYEALLNEASLLKTDADYVNFQLDELVKLNLKEGELSEMESEIKILEHGEEIKARFNLALENLTRSEYSAERILKEVRTHINAIASYSTSYETLATRLESLTIELKDIISEIEKEDEGVEFDPMKIETVKERLDSVYSLLQKHRMHTDSDLLQLMEDLQVKSDKTTNLDDELDKLKKDLSIRTKHVREQGKHLSDSRKKSFIPLSKKITELLVQLGIPHAQIKISHEYIEPGPKGSDQLEILFSANKGIDPQPLQQVASGGEFSRLMFCVKFIMADTIALPTLILDEIDSGVSGQIALQLGNLMKKMAGRHQVIAISHLPQIAAKADAHFFVFKDNSKNRTVSDIKMLNDAERIEEIAKMISGSQPTTRAMESAKELIDLE